MTDEEKFREWRDRITDKYNNAQYYAEGAFLAAIEMGRQEILQRMCIDCSHFRDASNQITVIKRRADWCAIGHCPDGSNMRENFSCRCWEEK